MEDITPQVEEAKEAIEALEPSVAVKQWKFTLLAPDGSMIDYTCTQDELGFFPVQAFTTMMTDIINRFVKGEFGVKLGELFRGDLRQQIAMPSELNEDSVNAVVEQNTQLIEAFLELIRLTPGLLQDIIVLSLGVPRNQAEWFKGAIQEPPHRGGLTVDEGFELIKVFIRQNAKLIRRFFEEKAAEVVEEFRLNVLDEGESVEGSAEEESPTEKAPEAEPEPAAAAPEPTPGGTPSSTSSQDTLASV